MDSQVCAVCQATRFTLIPLEDPNVQLKECQECRTAYTDPTPTAAELERHYSTSYYGPGNVKFIGLVERAVSLLASWRARKIHRLVKPHSRVLEIGCGRGLLLKSLVQLGHECHGTERSELAASRASQTVGIRIYPKPIEECHLPEGYFDLVILWHVLEHLVDPGSTLSTLFKLTKPGGLLLLEVPNYLSFQSRLAGKQWFHLDTEHHLQHFSGLGLQQLLEAKGFETLKTTTFNVEQCPYGVLQSFLNSLGLPREQLYRILKRDIDLPGRAKLLNYSLLTLFIVPSTLFSILEALLGRGGVLRVHAQRSLAG
jgi:2-polyprenyl-3-methyl-5-hydroxy-6-metoxy-1,4-benzoquinol methylase